MKIERFVNVGENIHCTRIYKVSGQNVKLVNGTQAIVYKSGGVTQYLPIPPAFVGGADWMQDKVKHCAVAIWQGVKGTAANQATGVHYLQNLARTQEACGANYLDINVDEFSTDVEERCQLMRWTVATVQKAVAIPVSIDSSNVAILRAGLAACDKGRSRPMVNSVSLERQEAIAAAAEFGAVVIASAAGEKGLPASLEEKLANIARLMKQLKAAGFKDGDIHVDPLVFPISTDGNNGRIFLDSVSAIRKTYGPDIHIVAGLSNVSFGMPSRKLINQVFSWLAVQAGADGGIVDPLQINRTILESMDPEAESFKLARALLLGEDEFGMEFITATREGRI